MSSTRSKQQKSGPNQPSAHRSHYTWRQQLLSFQGAMVTQTAPRFASVDLTPAPISPSPAPAASSAPSAPSRPEGLIEIVLSGGVSVRVDGHVDGRALRRVLDALGR